MKRLLVIITLCMLLIATGGTAAVSAARGGGPSPDNGQSPVQDYNVVWGFDYDSHATGGKITVNTGTGHYVANFNFGRYSGDIFRVYGFKFQVVGKDKTVQGVRIPVGEPQVVGKTVHDWQEIPRDVQPITLHWEGTLSPMETYWIAGHSSTVYFDLEPVFQ